VKRGTVCWVNLGTTHPPEFGKKRPGVVVSAVLPGIRQASRTRLGEILSVLPDDIMLRIDAALGVYLAD